LVGGIGVSDAGGETPGLPLPLDAHPGDGRPLERVERITLEDGTSGGQHHDDRFVVHAPTLAGAA